MGFWFAFFLFVGSTVLSALLQKRPKDVQPSSLGDFQAPTAQEGRPIPVVFGTVKLAAPNVVWFGDLKVVPIKKKSGGFLGIGAKKVTIGYKYYAGLWMALCHGVVDELLDIVVGEKSLGGTTSVRENMPFGQSQSKSTCTPARPSRSQRAARSRSISTGPICSAARTARAGLKASAASILGARTKRLTAT